MKKDIIKKLVIDIQDYYETESIGNPAVDFNFVYDLVESNIGFLFGVIEDNDK